MSYEQDHIAAFRAAVRRLYTVFSKYALRPDTEPCPCCHDPEQELVLHSKPLAELTPQDLEDYTRSALLTWGTDEDFKHFLPRIFEIAREQTVDLEIVFGKLHHACWREWPRDEQEAVEVYFEALWRYVLYQEDDGYKAEEILCGMAKAVDDLSPYLEMWPHTGKAGHRLLARFISIQYDSIAQKRELFDTFWRDDRSNADFQNDSATQMNQVIDWLLSPAAKTTLEEAYFIDPSDPIAEEMSEAVGILEHLTRIYPPEGG